MAENIRSRQDHIQFLEDYIKEITLKIDELTEGRDLEKEIESLEFRIHVLEGAGDKFTGRLAEIQKQLKDIKAKFAKVKPTVDELVEERAFYRHTQSGL